jgi:hypothetical protein
VSHAREAIRDAALAAITGLTTTGANAYTTIEQSFDLDELPAIACDIVSEQVIEFSISDEIHLRQATLRVRGWAARRLTATDVSETLDDIDQESATALFAATIGNELMYASMDKEYSQDGELFRGMITIDYSVIYSVDQSNPTTVIT